VLAAQQGTGTAATDALETLCRTYWYPLYAYVRRRGNAPHDAQDLTQEFFARLLAQEWLEVVVPERGKFRSFLLVAMQRFLANEYDRRTAQRRGGREQPLSLDADLAEQRYAAEPSLGPDEMFDRRWAMTLLDTALDRLKDEFAHDGKADEFEALKVWLTAGRGEIPYERLAAELTCSEGAARVAVHRMRKRFRELFRETIAQTVADQAQVDDEMRYVASILGRSA
jgi:RNA polymerase sigma-70 factor (ECF subfamily)